ncbi:MAG: serine/threonine-protein kinase [Planctomycetota bacterium]
MTEPARVLHYEFRREIGQGGMGVVFEGRDLRLDRNVAIKVLKPELAAREDDRQRFIAEARSVAAVQHPNVVTVHAVEDAPALPLIVMELLQGESLANRLNRTGSLDARESVSIAHAVANGLHAAHQHGLLHRDIKPANIWLESTGSSGETTVKILDFGLAETFESRAAQGHGGFAGTPAYVSPEQARSEPLDPRTDIYSLGVVLYRLLTGELPFFGDSRSALLAAIATRRVPPIESKRPDLPESLCAFVNSMVASSPEDRPRTAGSVVHSLTEIQSELSAGWMRKVVDSLRSPITIGYLMAAIIPAWIVWNGVLMLEHPRLLPIESNAVASNMTTPSGTDNPPREMAKVVEVVDVKKGLVKFRRLEVAGEPQVQAVLAEFDLSGLRDAKLIDAALRLPRSALPASKSEVAVWIVDQQLRIDGTSNQPVDLEQLFEEKMIVELASADGLDRIFNGIFRTDEYIGLATERLFELVEEAKGRKLRLTFEAENCDSKIDWSDGTQLNIEVLLPEPSRSNE